MPRISAESPWGLLLVALVTPGCVVEAPAGAGVLVADSVARFEAVWRHVSTVVPEQSDDTFLASIRGVDVGPYGRILITDVSESDLKVFGPDGRLEVVIGRLGDGPGELRNPFPARFDPSGGVAVYDAGPRRVSRFSLDGDLMHEVSVREVPPGVTDFLPLGEDRYLFVHGENERRALGLTCLHGDGRVVFESGPIPVRLGQAFEEHRDYRMIMSAAFIAGSGDSWVVVHGLDANTLTVGSGCGEDLRQYQLRSIGYDQPGAIPASEIEGYANVQELVTILQDLGELTPFPVFHDGLVTLPLVRGGYLFDLKSVDHLLFSLDGSEGLRLQRGPPALGAYADTLVTLENPDIWELALGKWVRAER